MRPKYLRKLIQSQSTSNDALRSFCMLFCVLFTTLVFFQVWFHNLNNQHHLWFYFLKSILDLLLKIATLNQKPWWWDPQCTVWCTLMFVNHGISWYFQSWSHGIQAYELKRREIQKKPGPSPNLDGILEQMTRYHQLLLLNFLFAVQVVS